MTFSVITATYNSEKTISRTLDSLLKQTFLDFEYIIIDGKSSDSTIEILKSYEKKFQEKNISFQWISEKDNGIYDAWNKGVKSSKGNWISFLGSDDYYLKDALYNYNQLIIANKNFKVDWVYSNVKFVYSNTKTRVLNADWTWKNFKRNITITPAHVGSFHNKEFFKKYGLYDTTYKIAGDYELLLRPQKKLKTLKLNKITAVMSAEGVSNSNLSKVLKETLKAKIKTGKVNTIICYYDYLHMWIKLKIKYFLKP